MDTGPSEVIPINSGLISLGPVSMLIFSTSVGSELTYAEILHTTKCANFYKKVRKLLQNGAKQAII